MSYVVGGVFVHLFVQNSTSNFTFTIYSKVKVKYFLKTVLILFFIYLTSCLYFCLLVSSQG